MKLLFLLENLLWPPVPVRKWWHRQCHPYCEFSDLIKICCNIWTLMYQCPSQSVVRHFNVYVPSRVCVIWKRAVAIVWETELSAAGENNLHLLQHYQRSMQLCLWGLCSLWHNRPVIFIISCLSMRFYLFILLTCFNFFYDYFFRLIAGLQWKVGWKADYFPLSCIPSCVDPVSLTLKDLTWSQPPGFRITGS